MSRDRLFSLFTLLLMVAPFVLMELTARSFLPPVTPLDLFVTPFEQEHNKRTDTIFEGDPLVGWRLRSGLTNVWWDYTLVSTNGAGVRAPVELEPKSEGVYRIVTLGDSVTFGYRAPPVFREEIGLVDGGQEDYGTQLARLLTRQGMKVEAFPLAVPGYSSRQGRLRYEELIGQLEADLVTILYGWNDTDLRPVPDRVTFDGDRWRAAGRQVVAASQLLSHLARWWSGPPPDVASLPPYDQWVPRSTPDESVENIAALADAALASGAKVIVIAPVYRDAEANASQAGRIGRLRQALAERFPGEGIDYLVVPELTEARYPANEVYFMGEPIHPNVAGHRLMAERLAALIGVKEIMK